MDSNIIFENMEILREKFKISYKEAKEVLDKNNNDLIDSLIYLESINMEEQNSCMLFDYLEIIKDKILDLYNEGQKQRLVLSRKGKTFLDIPLTAAVISSFVFVLYPIVVPLKIAGIIILDIDFKIVNKSGEVYHVNSDVKDKVNYAISTSKDRINDIITNADIKNKAVELGMKAKDNINDIIENKISKSTKDKASTYAQFIYDAEKEEIEEVHNNEENIEDIKVETKE